MADALYRILFSVDAKPLSEKAAEITQNLLKRLNMRISPCQLSAGKRYCRNSFTISILDKMSSAQNETVEKTVDSGALPKKPIIWE